MFQQCSVLVFALVGVRFKYRSHHHDAKRQPRCQIASPTTVPPEVVCKQRIKQIPNMKLIRVLLVSTLLPLSLLLVAVARPTTRTTTTRATTAKQRTRGIIPHKSSKLAAKTTFLSTSSSAAAVVDWKQELLQRAKVGFYFGLWYALNIVYNSKC